MNRRGFIRSLGAGLLVPLAPAIITSKGVVPAVYSSPGNTLLTPSQIASHALDALLYMMTADLYDRPQFQDLDARIQQLHFSKKWASGGEASTWEKLAGYNVPATRISEVSI